MLSAKKNFSLIVSTLGRRDEVKALFESLLNQGPKEISFEVVLVDQNSDERLLPIVDSYTQKISIVYLNSAKGLSKGRNVGIKHASGEFICFPDDDCEYKPGFLSRLVEAFSKYKDYDVIVGRTVDRDGNPSMGAFDDFAHELTPKGIWRNHNSVSLFFRKYVIDTIKGFDENLGIGAYWGSGAETDVVIRAMKAGFKFYYDPSLEVYHPAEGYLAPEKRLVRNRRYGRGVGGLLKKHQDFFGIMDKIKVFVGPLLRVVVRPGLLEKRVWWQNFIGRLEGYFSYGK